MWRLTWAVALATIFYCGRIVKGKCEYNPIGLRNTIDFPAGSFVGSTQQATYEASKARFGDNGWCANTADGDGATLTIDFRRLFKVCAVETKGIQFQDGRDSYISSFDVSFSLDGSTWNQYPTTLTNPDKSKQYHPLTGSDGIRVARYIKFAVDAFVEEPCLKVEVYRDKGECANHPVGISDSSIIPDGNLVATSADSGLEAIHARMSDSKAWCDAGSAELTIDFGESVKVCAIETQGYEVLSTPRSTSSFTLQFSTDGSTYQNYEESASQRTFSRIRGIETEFHSLFEPVTATHMKITGLDPGFCLSVEVYRSDSKDSCYDSTISFSATSGDSSTDASFPADDAILNDDDKAWCTTASAPNAYLQVDFGELNVVCAVAVQGLSDGSNNVFPTSFKLSFSYSDTDHEWADMYEEDGSVREFIISPADGNAIVKRDLAISQVAKHMRFYPTGSSDGGQFCLRVAVYGREGGCLRFPVGISDSFMIPDGSISATNSDPSYAATKVRMSDPSAWCLPDGQSGSPNLEVDFGENVLVCAVETRGYDSGDGLYAQEFELSFAANGGGFAKYTEDGGTRIFHKGLPTGQEVHMLNEPVTARKIRFEPVTGQGSQICTSLEVYRKNKEVSECQVADWRSSLGASGWSTCGDSDNYNTYIRGFYRAVQGNPDYLSRLEEADCCNPAKEVYNYENPTQDSQECDDEDFSELQGSDVWAECPSGYFLRGINIRDPVGADGIFLDDISHGKCCRPKHHYGEYGSCYDLDISSSFSSAGWSSCKEGFFMTGFYKGSCNSLHCMDTLRCCSMTTIQGRCYSETLPFDSTSSDSGTIGGYPAGNGILDQELNAWCTTNSYPDAYLQIDFGELHVVCAVSVQGRYTGSASGPNTFATKFKLAFTIENTDVWNFYEADGEDREYVTAPEDGDWVVNRRLAKSQMARYIRFYPTETSPSNQACLRVQVYGRRALSVTCNDDGSVVAIVARETLGPAIDTLNLNNPSAAGCSVAVPADHFDDLKLEFTVAECGTTHTKEGDYIVSTNHITGVAQGGIVQTYDTDFTVVCRHYATATLSNSFQPLHSVGDTSEGSGDLNFELTLYMDAARSNAYSNQQLDLTFDLYVRIQIASNPNFLTTMIDRCWATPSSDRNDATSYDLIVDSCGVGSAASISYDCNTADTIQNFAFKTFRFSEDSGSSYIHCNVRACLTGPSTDCYTSCNNACQGRKRRSFNQNSRNASNDPYPEMYFLDVGPIRVTEEQQAVPSAQEGKKHLSAAAITGIVLGCVCVLVVACAALFVAMRYRKKSEDNGAELVMYAGTAGTVNQAVSA
ncbi:uncharacterized protein LOC144636802 [Oculina patagonica]